jgi:hypothetical protein
MRQLAEPQKLQLRGPEPQAPTRPGHQNKWSQFRKAFWHKAWGLRLASLSPPPAAPVTSSVPLPPEAALACSVSDEEGFPDL